MKIFDRQNQKMIEETQYQEGLLNFLYNTLSGRILLKGLISTRLFSKIYAFTVTSKRSAKKIEPFIQRYQIDMEDYVEADYQSFSDFFIRKIKPERRLFASEENSFCSPADARLMVYPIDEELNFKIKNSYYSVPSLLQNKARAEHYKKGLCLVFRLAVTDYHRYHYIDNGFIKESCSIKGRLHTVSPISLDHYQIYSENSREWQVLATEHFGEIIQVEVGALLIGRITNYPEESFEKGAEKGYFSYGGSTIVMLLKEDEVKIDQDLWEWTQKGVECKIHAGEKIGVGKNV